MIFTRGLITVFFALFGLLSSANVSNNSEVDNILDSISNIQPNQKEFFELAVKAYNLSREANYENGILNSRLKIALYYYYQDKGDTAEVLFHNLLDDTRQKKKKFKEIYLNTLFFLGTLKFYKGTYDDAIHYFGGGLIFSQETNKKNWEATFLAQLGGVYQEMENYNKASDFYLDAISIANEIEDNKLLSSLYLQIGSVLTSLQEYDSSLMYFKKANDLVKFDSLSESYSIYHINVGHLLTLMKQYDKALENFRKSLKCDTQRGDKYGIAITLNNIGDIYNKMGITDSAYFYLEKAIELSENIGYPSLLSIAYTTLGEIEFNNRNYSKSVEYASKSLEIAKKTSNIDDVLDACKLLYEGYSKLNKYDKAFQHLLMYQNIKDSLFNIEKEKVKYSLKTKFQQEKQIQLWKEKSKYEKKLKIYMILIALLIFMTSSVIIRNFYLKNKSQKQLIRQKEYFDALRENSEDVVFVINKECELTYISPSYERKTGRKIEERINRKAPDFIHPEDVPVLRSILKNAINNKKSVHHFEFRIKKEDGEWIYVSAAGKNCLDNPDINGFIVNVWDITERKKYEKQLKQSEKSYRDLFNNATDAIFVHTEKGKIIDVNKGAEIMFGYTREELIGQLPIFLGAPGMNDAEALVANVKKAFNGSPSQFEFWARRKNGEIFPMLVRVNNSLFFGKQVLITFAIDISDIKEAEKRIRESEENFRRIFEAFPDIYFKSDPEGIVVDVSPSVERIAGYKREEIIGKPEKDFYMNDDDWDMIGETLRKQGYIKDVDVKLKTKCGKLLHCSLNANIIYDENGNFTGIDGIVRDITERVKMTNLLKKSEAELKEANNTKEILLSVIGHDIIGPIGTNKAMTDLIIKDGHRLSKEKIIEFVSSIKPTIDSTYNMIENLVTWSKFQRKKLELTIKPGYLKPIVEEIFSLFNFHALTKEISLVYNGNEMQAALFDKDQMTIIIRNLVSNAIKFTKHGGTVTVTLGETEEMAFVRVSDTGIGMTKEQIRNISDENISHSWTYGTNNEKGTGLGMSIVSLFVKQNNGKLKIESYEGKGTKITVYLQKIT